ncbi:hypothetical protein OAV29_03075 [Candidatus Poseidoniaceae archaeon]|nr:hypothetical protein [Candidatus Poseidoniaceae archaeon]
MEQVYTSSREDFLERLENHPYVEIQNSGDIHILRKGWLQMITLSIMEMEEKIVVRFRPKISLIGLMILATVIVISIATISWVWTLLEVVLIGFALLIHSSQLTWEMLQFTQEPIEFSRHSSNG